MKLKAHINGKEYDIEQGATFSEEYNETLDSGCIIITDVPQMSDLLPFDDVYIHTGESFGGYNTVDSESGTETTILIDNIGHDKDESGIFYRHLLVDQFTEEVLRLNDSPITGSFKYKIELQSETKKLEKIILPNISLTQPLVGEKISVYDKIVQLVELYSPEYKVAINSNEWEYRKKYRVDLGLRELFGNVYSPDFTLNCPTLKDAIAKLMSVKDCIPMVKDDVICAMDISKRGRLVTSEDTEYFNSVTGSRTSDNHADNLRRTYSNALSSDNTCKVVEYLGFRNSDSALMTIKNMRLETSMPIYKVSKVKMCYYRKARVFRDFSSLDYDSILFNVFVNYVIGDIVSLSDKIYYCIQNCKGKVPNVQPDYWKELKENENTNFLCKQDITPIVKLNTERNVLSQDWDKLHSVTDCPKNINEMGQYKFCTVGYDIGGKHITGWGEMYQYPNLFWNRNYSTIENILMKVDYFNPYGEQSAYREVKQNNNVLFKEFLFTDNPMGYWDIVNPETNSTFSTVDLVEAPFSNDTLKFKGIFFEVEYQAFYNGTIIHSKDNERDDITTTDNASDSLTILERDGVMQKEKANRFGNKNVQITARYGGNELDKVLPLSAIYDEQGFERDVIIYHREYMIWDNCIKAIYYGTKNYVLKNYFVSVFAKYRTWQTMSYSESVYRAENVKDIVLYSKDKLYYEETNNLFANYDNALSMLFSSINPHTINDAKSLLVFDKGTKLNYCYLDCGLNKYYASDINVFSSGDSFLINMKMFDNYSQGTYISNPEPFIWRYDNDGNLITDKSWISKSKEWFNTHDDYTGSKQDWLKISENVNATLDTIGFYACNKNDDIFANNVINTDEVNKNYLDTIFQLPKLNNVKQNVDTIGVKKEFYKDNKDVIDMTLQIENKTNIQDFRLSSWNLKLNDWIDTKHKIDEDISQEDYKQYGLRMYGNSAFIGYIDREIVPILLLSLPLDTFNKLRTSQTDYKLNNTFFCNFGGTESVTTYVDDTYFIKSFICNSFNIKQETNSFGEVVNCIILNGTIVCQRPQAVGGNIISNTLSIKLLEIKSKSHTSPLDFERFDNAMYDAVCLDASALKDDGELMFFSDIEIRQNNTSSFETSFGQAIFYGASYNKNNIENYKCQINANTEITMTDRTGRYCPLSFGKDSYETNDEDEAGYMLLNSIIIDRFVFEKRKSRKYNSYNYIIQKVDVNDWNKNYRNYLIEDENGDWQFENIKYSFNESDTQDFSKDYYTLVYSSDISRATLFNSNILLNINNRDKRWNINPDIVLSSTNSTNVNNVLLYRKNMFILLSDKPVDDVAFQDSYINNATNKNKFLRTDKVQDWITFETDENGVPYIKLNLSGKNIPTGTKSIQYWYLDDISAYSKDLDVYGIVTQVNYNADNCYYHFVAGFNITEQDISRGYVKIYMSIVKGKDQRVFDQNHNVIGKSKNYVGNEEDYGEKTKYELS